MIKLDIDSYCDNCPEFETVERAIKTDKEESK